MNGLIVPSSHGHYPMPTYKLTIEYEGTRYSGWQAQANTEKTVQGKLQRVAAQLFGKCELGGSGRTDAGVHAAGQVAHLRLGKSVDPGELARSLNDALPHDIHVLGAERAGDRFHARHDAVARVYLYQIATRRTAFAKPFVWWIKDRLDADRMAEAVQHCVGKHDFARLSDRHLEAESTLVVVENAVVGRGGDLILIRLGASHFLWKMVRKIVAALVEVGRGRLEPQAFAQIVHEPAGKVWELTAPPSGLFLEAVLYAGESFDRPLEPLVPIVTPSPRAARLPAPGAPPVGKIPMPRPIDIGVDVVGLLLKDRAKR